MRLFILLMITLSRATFVHITPKTKSTRTRIIYDTCQYNSDCILPQICCKGILNHFCCDIGAKGTRIRNLPNITLPEFPKLPDMPQFPPQSPQPIPVPIYPA